MTAVVNAPASGRPCDSEQASVPGTLSVTTTAADETRASIHVEGVISAHTCPLLLGVITTHVRAGRRHLRVDLADAEITEHAVLAHLVSAHHVLHELGGMLVFDKVPSPLSASLRNAELLVVPAA